MNVYSFFFVVSLNGYIFIVKILFEVGVKVNLLSKDGFSFLYVVC